MANNSQCNHGAAIGYGKVITELMSYKACKIDVKTKKPAIVAAGKTAAQITKSKNVKKAILCKLEEEKKKYKNVPTCVDIQSAQLNLMCYVQGAVENYTICEKMYNQSCFGSFLAMEEKIFSFVNTGDNWISVRDIVANEVGRIDACERTNINSTQDKAAFFTYLIQLYTRNSYYLTLNSHLRRHPLDLPDVTTEIQNNQESCRVYTALTNAVLFHATLPILGNQFTNTTYRGAELSDEALKQYKMVGTKFAWLSFTSSSSNNDFAFPGNCQFIINNGVKCPWSPRGIESKFGFPGEHEYLYPCGAHFEITKFMHKNHLNIIHLKLINIIQPIQLIYDEEKLHYDSLVTQYNRIYHPLFEERRLVDKACTELRALYIYLESLKKFENVVVESKSRRIDLPKGLKAFHCRDCNTTCDYPCPDTHMPLRRCEFYIPRAEDACTKCQGRCHFSKHSRVGYRLEVELVTKRLVDEVMKAEYTVAVAEFQSKENEYKSMKEKWERDFTRLPKGIQLIEDIQKSIQDQTDILSVEENKTWDNYDDILIQLIECRGLVEECRYQLSEWGLL